MRLLDLKGQKFGRLTVIEISPDRYNGLVKWKCACECGSTKIALAKTLRNGGTKSCGCLHLEESVKKVMAMAKPIGSKRFTSKGYIEVKTESGYKREHVYVMELHLGRKLEIGEVVHHIDCNKQNNSIENLMLMTHGEHSAHHNKERNRNGCVK